MSEGAFSSRLPRLIDPGKLAQQELSLQGFVPPEALARVAEAVLGLSRVECSLAFRVDERYRRIATGAIRAQVDLCCQRCLGAVGVDVEVDVHVALIKEEARAKDLPSWLDPWLAAEVDANLYDLVEDELLLNLPQFAWHEENCVDPALYSSGEPVEESETEKENPFRMLEQLKQKE